MILYNHYLSNVRHTINPTTREISTVLRKMRKKQ